MISTRVIVNNLKYFYAKNNDISEDTPIFDKDIAKEIGMVVATLSTAINREMLPYKYFVMYCIKKNISLDAVFKETQDLKNPSKRTVIKKGHCINSKCGAKLDETNSRGGRNLCRKCLSEQSTASAIKTGRTKSKREVHTHCSNKSCGVELTDETKYFTGRISRKDGTKNFRNMCKTCVREDFRLRSIAKRKANTRVCEECGELKDGAAYKTKSSKKCNACADVFKKKQVKVKIKKTKAPKKVVKPKKTIESKKITQPIVKEKVVTPIIKKEIVKEIELSTSEKMAIAFKEKEEALATKNRLTKEEQMIEDFLSKNKVVMSRGNARYCEEEYMIDEDVKLAQGLMR